MIDLHFRATSKRAFVKLGRALDFIDADNREMPGVDIDFVHKGQMVHTPATYDGDGNQLTAPVVDNTHIHVNVRLSHWAAWLDKIDGTDEDGFDKSKIRRWLKNNATLVDVPSMRQPGVMHHWFSKDFGNGDVVWLVWPVPEMARRVWL